MYEYIMHINIVVCAYYMHNDGFVIKVLTVKIVNVFPFVGNVKLQNQFLSGRARQVILLQLCWMWVM